LDDTLMTSSIESFSFERGGHEVRPISRPCAGSIVLLRGGPSHPEIVDGLEAAVDRHPRLRRRRVQRRGRLAADWVEHGFDLSYHLRWERIGNDRDLLGVATRRFFQPLAHKAPPWELHVLEGD